MTSTPDARLADVLALLTDPATTLDEAHAAMARLDGRELAELPRVFAVLRGSDDPAEIQAAARLLRRWAALPLADALPRALRALVAEARVGDMNKLAAAALLESLGHPLDELELAHALADPDALKRTALERLVDASARPSALVHALETLAALPLERLLALIDDLGALGRPDGSRLLASLAHARDADVAISAIAALDRLGEPDTVGALPAIARHHADPTVRDQAARTLARLPHRTVANGIADMEQGCLAWRQTAPGPTDTDRLLLVATAPDARGARDVLTTLLRRGSGIAHYAMAGDLDTEAVAALRGRLAEGGLELAAAPVAEARRALEDATAETLTRGRVEDVAWAAWRWVLPPPSGP